MYVNIKQYNDTVIIRIFLYQNISFHQKRSLNTGKKDFKIWGTSAITTLLSRSSKTDKKSGATM